MDSVDYVFFIERPGHEPLLRVSAVDVRDEERGVSEMCERLKQKYMPANIRFSRRPTDDTMVILRKFV